MELPSLTEIQAAQAIVYRVMPPTPQYSWPLVNARLGVEARSGAKGGVWIKHENHSPVGAFKLRGALVYVGRLKEEHPRLEGVVAATRGNFGQGVAMAARLNGLKAAIVVPHGNSVEKNRSMVAQGAELIEEGHDFQAAFEFAQGLARGRGYAFVDSFHELLVRGTATYALELFEGAPELDRVYVPIGQGSSICGVAAARNALGRETEIVGVTAARAPSFARSFAAHALVEAPAETEIADGLAVRRPNAEALEVILREVARIVEVTEEEIKGAMRALYEDTHNLAEGAGAAAMAAAMKEREGLRGQRVGVVLTGGNVDGKTFAPVLESAGALGETR
jgi:threonine dehydratase